MESDAAPPMAFQPALVPILTTDGWLIDEGSSAAKNPGPADAAARSTGDASRQHLPCIADEKQKARNSKFSPFIRLCKGGISSPESMLEPIEFGRTEILTSTYSACGCIQNTPSTPNNIAEPAVPNGGTSKKRGRLSLCSPCREAESWAVRFLSRKMIRFVPVPDENQSLCYRVQLRGENAFKCVLIDGAPPGTGATNDTDGWSGEKQVKLRSTIAIQYPSDSEHAGGGLAGESACVPVERSCKRLTFQLCLVSATSGVIAPEAVSMAGLCNAQRSRNVPPILRKHAVESPASNATASTTEVPSSIPLDGSQQVPGNNDTFAAPTSTECPAIQSGAQSTNEAPSSSPRPNPQAEQKDTTRSPCTERSIVDICSPESTASNAKNSQERVRPSNANQEDDGTCQNVSQISSATEATPMHQARPSDARKPHPSPIDLTTSPVLKKPPVASTMASAGIRRINCTVYFLQLGRGMPRTRIELLTKALEQKPGVQTTESFDFESSPTHVVLDPNLGAANAASALGFKSPETMAMHFKEKNILAVTPQWVFACKDVNENPGLELSWGGLRTFQANKNASKESKGRKRQLPPGKGWMTKSRNIDEFAPISVVKASTLKNDVSVGRMLRRRQAGDDEYSPSNESALGGITNVMRGEKVQKCTIAPPKRNEALSSMFDELASVQKECPLSDMDQWRAYTYNLVAGRLRHLDFEVTPDKDILGSLRGIRGFGTGVMKKVNEFFVTGTCEKLKELQTDPTRLAVRSLTNIWGVGPKKASELVKRGYQNIADVRRGLASGSIDLSDNANIGVDCYEDFLEKMERSEVKMIGDIVAAAVWKEYPEAEVSTMGSYRRGKAQCGDTDVLIVHPAFLTTTPKGSLARILRGLEKGGHIAHHLTAVKGAKDLTDEGSEISSYQDSEDAPGQTVDDNFRTAVSDTLLGAANDYHKSVSWMGVFRSPCHEGKRRRVDIKFYPYREKAFAKLYFSGSGSFNRSMRLWATKSCSMTLNDHGLYKLSVSSHHEYYRMERADKRRSRSERIDCKTEKEIFDALNLEYRAPSERICFDSVVEKGTSKPISLGDLSEKDIEQECWHRWVD